MPKSTLPKRVKRETYLFGDEDARVVQKAKEKRLSISALIREAILKMLDEKVLNTGRHSITSK